MVFIPKFGVPYSLFLPIKSLLSKNLVIELFDFQFNFNKIIFFKIVFNKLFLINLNINIFLNF